MIRTLIAAATALPLWAGAAVAEIEIEEVTSPGGALDPTTYASLTADDEAQVSLGGFRLYLERIEESDPQLYGLLDGRLRDLEDRSTAADVVFGVSLGLAVAGALGAIPAYELAGEEPAIGVLLGSAGLLLIGAIVQAIIRPGHGELVALIDLHDERVGRR